jgi:hypothetical protein
MIVPAQSACTRVCKRNSYHDNRRPAVKIVMSDSLIRVKSVRKIETGLKRGRWLSTKLRNTVLMHSMRRGDQPWKLSLPIRGTKCFRSLHTLIGVKSVRKIARGQ